MTGSRWACLALAGTVACEGGAPNTAPEDLPIGRCVAATAELARLLPPLTESPTALTPTRWLLVYAGSRLDTKPAYRVPQFRRLLTHVDSAGRSQYWVFSGAIFLLMYAPTGHVFTTWIGGTPANGADWTAYLDSLFIPGAALARLDSTVALTSASLGPLPEPFRVSIMIPYPEPTAGNLAFGGQVYDLATVEGRVGAAAAYVDEAVRRFDAAGLPNLKFDGFYWLREEAPTGDQQVIPPVAAQVHGHGVRFLWIPYYTAESWSSWRDFGFDAAWLQPNYFFDLNLATERLDSAAARAKDNGMGMEVEFDGRVWADSMFCDRLHPYISTLVQYPELRTREIALYEGGGALIHLSFGWSPEDRMLYQAVGEVLR